MIGIFIIIVFLLLIVILIYKFEIVNLYKFYDRSRKAYKRHKQYSVSSNKYINTSFSFETFKNIYELIPDKFIFSKPDSLTDRNFVLYIVATYNTDEDMFSINYSYYHSEEILNEQPFNVRFTSYRDYKKACKYFDKIAKNKFLSKETADQMKVITYLRKEINKQKEEANNALEQIKNHINRCQ